MMSERVRQTLERVAAVLGCSVEALVTGDGLPLDVAQADELLSLWMSLKSDEDRQRVLRFAREAAAKPKN